MIGVAGAVLLATVLAAAVWRLRRRYVVVTVQGRSMEPTYRPGDRVLVRRGRSRVGAGDVVVVGEPDRETGWHGALPLRRGVAGRGWFIKRVVATPGTRYPVGVGFGGTCPPGHVALLGDNVLSLDSRDYGPCPEHQILGVVARKMSATSQGPEAAGA